MRQIEKYEVIILFPDGLFHAYEIDKPKAQRIVDICNYKFFEYDPTFSGINDESLPLRERFKGLVSMLFGYKFKARG